MRVPHTEPDRQGDPIECLRNVLHLSAAFWLLIAAVVLAGCAQPSPTIWDKEGATQQDYNREAYACARDALVAGGTAYIGFGYTERVADQRVFYACMVAHGWTARRQ